VTSLLLDLTHSLLAGTDPGSGVSGWLAANRKGVWSLNDHMPFATINNHTSFCSYLFAMWT